MLQKDQAVCLRKVDYSETSQVVTLFARDSGKFSAIAKGSKRPKSAFDGTIELFSYGAIVFAPPVSSDLATLTEFQQQPLVFQSALKLLGLNCCLFAAELVEKFIHQYDPHPELFDSFTNFLTEVQHTKEDFESLALLILFQLTLLKEVGTAPVLSGFTNCAAVFSRRWPGACFCSSANGLVCPDCEQAFVDKIRLSEPAAACLADLKNLTKTTQKTLGEIEKVLICHFTELLNRPPKMAKYFLKAQDHQP